MSRLSFQSLVQTLQKFWADRGCLLEYPLDLEVGAGTMHPATFLRVLGPEPWNVAYVQPSRRPADGRYGDNPFRLGKHYQFQVILKPSPLEVQELYLDSLRALGLDLTRHDLRFEEDNWEAPTLGAWGVGWQILLDGMEITQFTYFQQAGGIDLAPISAELTYGIERLTMFLSRKSSAYDIEFGGGFGYGPVRKQEEYEFSRYYFEVADIAMHWKLFDAYESEARRCLDEKLVLPAYDWTLKCSHIFNTLDARGAVSVTERVGVTKRVRDLAVRCAKEYLESRRALDFPLLSEEERTAWHEAHPSESVPR
ncbi:MAG TPA: glycine--tRNA ligase subunit alpha [Thermoanaerobaculia bacterium]|nr:glycine--tRNA ligase subunit alpha [Thermoanaerobaculia bacterium]